MQNEKHNRMKYHEMWYFAKIIPKTVASDDNTNPSKAVAACKQQEKKEKRNPVKSTEVCRQSHILLAIRNFGRAQRVQSRQTGIKTVEQARKRISLQFGSAARGRDLVVEQRGQEIRVVLARHLAGEVAGRKLELVALGALLGELVGLLLEELEGVALVDLLALRGADAVARPLPELAAADFGGGGVLLWSC